MTAAAYEEWLHDNAVRWVALPAAPLDFSAGAERDLLERGLPFLEPVHESPNWRIWEVRDALPPVEGPAELVAAGADGFDLEASGTGDVLSASTARRTGRSCRGCLRVRGPVWLDDGAGAPTRPHQRPRPLQRRRGAPQGARRADGDEPVRTGAVNPPVTGK